jgi:uncharacterized protein YneF (UPF0154 family)
MFPQNYYYSNRNLLSQHRFFLNSDYWPLYFWQPQSFELEKIHISWESRVTFRPGSLAFLYSGGMIVISYRTVYEPIRQESLHATCPLCDTEAMINLELYQVVTETSGIVTRTAKMTSSATCTHCAQNIPVTKWTKPMQDTFEHIKRNTKLTRKVTVKKRFWWVIGIGLGSVVVLLSVALIGGYFSSQRAAKQEQQFEAVVSNPQINDKLVVMTISNATILNSVYKVIAVDDETITAIASEQTNTNPVSKLSDFDTSDAAFTGKTVTVVKQGFSQYQNWVEVGHEDDYTTTSVVHAAGRQP